MGKGKEKRGGGGKGERHRIKDKGYSGGHSLSPDPRTQQGCWGILSGPSEQKDAIKEKRTYDIPSS